MFRRKLSLVVIPCWVINSLISAHVVLSCILYLWYLFFHRRNYGINIKIKCSRSLHHTSNCYIAMCKSIKSSIIQSFLLNKGWFIFSLSIRSQILWLITFDIFCNTNSVWWWNCTLFDIEYDVEYIAFLSASIYYK